LRILDLFLFVFLGIGAFGGYRRGFTMEAVSTVGWVIGLLTGFMLLDLGMAILEPFVGKSWLLPRISYFCIFVCTVWGLNYVAKWTKNSIKKTLLGDFDTWAGALLGLIKMVFVLSIVCTISLKLNFKPKQVDEGKKLYIYPVIQPIAPNSIKALLTIIPPVSDLKKAFLERFKDSK
jgi:membrane protein required for colicin V production